MSFDVILYFSIVKCNKIIHDFGGYDTKRAAVYARYSSTGQREESITAQLRAAVEYCKKKEYTIVKEFTDAAESGKTDNLALSSAVSLTAPALPQFLPVQRASLLTDPSRLQGPFPALPRNVAR